MSARQERGDGAVPRWTTRAAGILGAAALAGGLALVGSLRRGGVTGGVLLLVAALGLLATALGQEEYGPEVEGRLDLSARLAAGALGGALGGLAHLLLAWATGLVGLPDLLGVDLAVWLTPAELADRSLSGALWGLAFGIVHPWVPGRGSIVRGLVFSAAPALWVLLWVYPGMKYGLFGVELGALTFAVVALHHLAWGAVVGGVIRWAERTDVGPVSRPLGA